MTPLAKHCEEKIDEIVKCFQAVADKYRFRVLRMLEAGPLPLGVIQQVLDLGVPDLKKHLAILKAADLISEFKKGSRVLYCLKRKPDTCRFYSHMFSLVKEWQNWNPLIKRDKVKAASLNE